MRIVLDRAARVQLDGVTTTRLAALVEQGRVQIDEAVPADLGAVDIVVAADWRTRVQAERMSERLVVLRPAGFAELLARVAVD